MAADVGHEPPTKRRKLSTDPTRPTQIDVDDISFDVQHRDSETTWSIEQRKEQQVGIRAYVNADAKTFTGTLKLRYSDFLVNEILLSGEVIHLRDTRPPNQIQKDLNEQLDVQDRVQRSNDESAMPEVASQTVTENRQHQQENATNSLPEITYDQRKKLSELLNETAASEICALYASIRDNPAKKANEHPLVMTDFTTDRSVRGRIHQFIRETFQSCIDSSTNKDGVLVLTATKPSRGGKQGVATNGWHTKSPRQSKLSWMERGGEYLHFTLYKENKDTMEAVSWLAKQLKCNPKDFQFAGTKDRRAITSQRCSAKRVEVERLAQQNRTLRGAKVGDFSYHQEGLELGDLSGNEFVITLRDCTIPGMDVATLSLGALRQDLQARMQSLHENGYINYYGQQRFGTFSMRTDVIGRHILKGDFQGACNAILNFQQDALEAAQDENSNAAIGQDDKSRALAIHSWKSDNKLNAALDILPRKFSAEAQIMRHLTRSPNDFLGALLTIQRNLRVMYVHAYQSYVWNLAVSHRMQMYGNKVVKGDLVLVNEHKDKQKDINDSAQITIDADGEQIIEPASHDRAAKEDDVFERARGLTEDEANSGEYSIFDIVLPQPGYDVLYPDNETGVFYKTFMASPEGGELDPYNMRRKQKDFSLSGAYRKILARTGKDYYVEVHRYDKDEEQFVKTDLDLMNEAERPDSGQPANVAGVEKEEKGGKIAVVLKFQLGASQYATMAIRELSKGGIVPYKPDFNRGR